MRLVGSWIVALLLLIPLSSCRASTPEVPATLTTEATMGTPESQGVLVIQGIFDPAGENLLELKPIYLYPRKSAQIPQQQQGLYLVKVIYVTGEVTSVPFDALIADDSGRTVHGAFEVEVPIEGKIDSILITDASGQKTFARIEASEILEK